VFRFKRLTRDSGATTGGSRAEETLILVKAR